MGVSKRGGKGGILRGSNSTNIRSLKEQTDERLDTVRLFVSGVLSTLIRCLFIQCIKNNNSCLNSILELFVNYQDWVLETKTCWTFISQFVTFGSPQRPSRISD